MAQYSFNEFYLNESSLSRLYSKLREYDCGIISAFRNKEKCGDKIEDKKYTRQENLQRTAKLLAQLNYKGYSPTRVLGGFVENYGTEFASSRANEVSFFVCDEENKGKLRKDLMDLGFEYTQDSIIYIPINGNPTMISTNNCSNGFPGRGEIGVENQYEKIHYGKESEFFTKVGDRPFFFEAFENIDCFSGGIRP